MDYICKDVSSKQTNKIQSLAALDQAKVWLVCMEVKGKGAGLGFRTGGERFGVWTGFDANMGFNWVTLDRFEVQLGLGMDQVRY